MLIQISAVWAPPKPRWSTMIHNNPPRPTWRIMKSLPWTPRNWSTGDPLSWQTFPLSATCEVRSLGKWLHPLYTSPYPYPFRTRNRLKICGSKTRTSATVWQIFRQVGKSLLSVSCWVEFRFPSHRLFNLCDQTAWEVTWITWLTWYARKKVFHRRSKPIFVSHI